MQETTLEKSEYNQSHEPKRVISNVHDALDAARACAAFAIVHLLHIPGTGGYAPLSVGKSWDINDVLKRSEAISDFRFPNPHLFEEHEKVAPRRGEFVLPKLLSSAFTFTQLERFLRKRKISDLFIAGVKTNKCVSATAKDAIICGFNTTVLFDCTAAMRVEEKHTALKNLEKEGVRLMSLESFLKSVSEQDGERWE